MADEYTTNLVTLFEASADRVPDRPLFGTKGPDGSYSWVSYREVAERVDHLRAGLAGLGIDRGDAVGLIANNRVEWAVAAFACYGLGVRFVPMYEAELERIWRHIIADSGVRLVFVSKPEILDKVQVFVDEIDTLERLVLIDGEGPDTMAALEEAGAAEPVPSATPEPDDVAVLIYTSGTTADPKGVLLTHRNLAMNAQCAVSLHPQINEQTVNLSILPWAHSYGQVADLYAIIHVGGSMGFMESIDTLADDLQAVRPTFLVAVPRVFNKIHAGLYRKMEETGGVARALFQMGVAAAQAKREGRGGFLNDLKLAVADRVVFEKVRQRFGGRLEGVLTGSATMNPDVAWFFRDIGVPCYDAYGLTETSPAATLNCPDAWKIGSVGRAIPGVTVEIDKTVVEEDGDEGEIIIRGHNVMKGYHNLPEKTAEVLDEDGGFRTGDRGRLDEDGFLFITGRIKEQYKLENGKYVFPSGIEEHIGFVPEVTSAMVLGAGRPYNIALVVPDFAVLGPWAEERGLPTEPEELVAAPEAIEHVGDQITAALRPKVASYEVPRKFVLIAEDFSKDNGLLTQTLKLKRRAVVARYEDVIGAVYQG